MMMSDLHPTGSSPEDGSPHFSRLPSSDILRRSSSRSIKRKKFDDELVDTSNPFKRMSSSRRSSESSQPDQKPPSVTKKVDFENTLPNSKTLGLSHRSSISYSNSPFAL